MACSASAGSRPGCCENRRRRAMTEAVLRTERLSKHFGGLAAVNDVSLEFFTDQIHAVIGPNGAGKTTLASLLSGDLASTSGRIYLDGEDIAGLSAPLSVPV